MKTWFQQRYELKNGKRLSQAFVPVLQDLAASAGSAKCLVRDSSTGEMREQNIADGDSYGYWVLRVAGVSHMINSQLEAEFIAGSPSLSYSREWNHTNNRWLFTLKNNGGVPISNLGSLSSYSIPLNEDALYKIHLTSYAEINFTDLKPDVSHTVILHLSATTSMFEPLRVVSWKCNGNDIPSICFHADAPIGWLTANNNYLVSITNHGGGNTDLAISYIKIKS
jgi:hypothetical protein